jgi:hemerythrin superfamily protein
MPVGTHSTSKGRTTTKSRAKAPKQLDAIKLLMNDHDEVEAMFKQFMKMKKDGTQKADLIEQICNALSVHAEIEEEIFYPACRDALGENGEMMLDEAEVEHASIKSLVEQLQDADPDDEMTAAKVKVLCEYVTHHVKEEEGTIFPKVKKSDLDLDDLGAELMERKQELMGEEGE